MSKQIKNMKLVVTIDTEEDNWGDFSATNYSSENIQALTTIQQMFDEYNTKPTYLVTYQVACDSKAVSILKELLHTNRCEIGAHCHPWNTPPFEEERNPRNSMLCNLPVELQYKKIATLHDKITEQFGIEAISFRAGRWGYDQEVAKNLLKIGYRVDTSVLSYTNWSERDGPDYSRVSGKPYWFSSNNVFQEDRAGQLLEVPATVGFVQNNAELAAVIHKIISCKAFKKAKFGRFMQRLNLLNRVALSPEESTTDEMIMLTNQLRKEKHNVINLFFHSPSLKPGLSPFVKTEKAHRMFIENIRDYLTFVKKVEIESVRLSDCELFVF